MLCTKRIETICTENCLKGHYITFRFFLKDCFEFLLKLLNWSWNTFCAAVEDVKGLKGTSLTAAVLDLERLVYISTASLRLIRTYVTEVYPNQGKVPLFDLMYLSK